MKTKSPTKVRSPKTAGRSRTSRQSCPMKKGRYYRFLCPRHNFSGVLSPMDRRRIRCDSIRDLKNDPIDMISVEIQPLLRRSRYLVTGLDLDIGEERSFYTDSLRDIVEIDPVMQYAVINRDDIKPLTNELAKAVAFAGSSGGIVVRLIDTSVDNDRGDGRLDFQCHD